MSSKQSGRLMLDLSDIYAITKTEKVAVVLSCAYVNEYLKYHIKMTDNNKKKTLFEFSISPYSS
mgnify:CR=1 FL=1